ncbi:MAG: pilus assembly protein [Proteobacteria bacterium]|nr:pilus assembly protein [Pseudomonadota bacterium]
MKRREMGLTTVEFAVVATALFIMLFAVIEFSRVMYSFAVLSEGTRRAARLATVCPLNDAGVTATVNFSTLPGFSSGNVQVSYLDAAGTPTGTYSDIVYVRVQITGYSIPLSIPFVNPTVTSPAFPVTLPRESLGVTPTATYTCS